MGEAGADADAGVGVYQRERDAAIRGVFQAARLCREVQQRLVTGEGGAGVLSKSDLSPVTVADYGSQALICRDLAAAFPDDPIIAEEDAADLRKPENTALLEEVVVHVKTVLGTTPEASVNGESICNWIDRGGTKESRDRFWTLDPIDGTKGFLRGEQYAVALALIEKGEVVVGALACPNLPPEPETSSADAAKAGNSAGTIFVAVRGQGAWMIPLAAGEWEGALSSFSLSPIHVSDRTDGAQTRFCESVESGHSAHGDSARIAEKLGITAAPARLDSQAKYGVVARGEADIYLRLPTRADYREAIWDHAAGALVVDEAGGIVSDINGRPLDFTQGRRLASNRGVVVTNGPWHQPILAAIAELGIV
jgi:3'(2'), 5'-bisphosphate nucleotidase